MKDRNFIKKNIVDLLGSLKEEELNSYAKELAVKNVPEDFLLNRNRELFGLFKALNSDINFISICGFLGTGKTEAIHVLDYSLEENVFKFYFKCSPVTNLDDIILSLYLFVSSSPRTKDIRQRTSKDFASQSIDEKLISYLKNIKHSFVIIIDSIEHIINDNDEIIDKEISNFLNYIISLPYAKLVVAGKMIPFSSFKNDAEKSFNLRISGLEEELCYKIFRNSNVTDSDQILFQVFQYTRGYPLSIKYFIKTLESLNISIFDILKDYASRKDGFEEYLLKKMYFSIPNDFKKILWTLASIRHPIKEKSFYDLELSYDMENCVNYLKDNLFISSSNEEIYVKDFVKSIIYPSIPSNEKINIHKFLHEVYTAQIPLKPQERLFFLSRKTMHAEQYYHLMCLNKSEKEYKASGLGKKPKYSAPIPFIKKTHDFSYISTNIIDTNTFLKPEIDKNVCQPIQAEKKHQSSSQMNDLDVELTEEETMLLEETLKATPANERRSKTAIPYEISLDSIEHPSTSKKALEQDYFNFAEAEEKSENYAKANENYEKAYAIAQSERDVEKIAVILNKTALNLKKMGKFDEAIVKLKKALEIYTSLHDANKSNLVSLNIAKTFSENFKHDIALNCFQSLLEKEHHGLSTIALLGTLTGIADIHNYRSNLEIALKFYKEAAVKAVKLSDQLAESEIYFKIALIYDDLGDYKNALEYYLKNTQVSNDCKLNQYLSASYANIGAIYEESNDLKSSIINYEKSFEIDKSINNYEGMCKSLSKIGNILFDTDNIPNALHYFYEALKAAKMSGDSYYIATSYLEIGDSYFAESNYEKAIKAFIMARKTIANTISTDSKEKIERRFRNVVNEIGEKEYNRIIKELKKNNE